MAKETIPNSGWHRSSRARRCGYLQVPPVPKSDATRQKGTAMISHVDDRYAAWKVTCQLKLGGKNDPPTPAPHEHGSLDTGAPTPRRSPFFPTFWEAAVVPGTAHCKGLELLEKGGLWSHERLGGKVRRATIRSSPNASLLFCLICHLMHNRVTNQPALFTSSRRFLRFVFQVKLFQGFLQCHGHRVLQQGRCAAHHRASSACRTFAAKMVAFPF